MKIPWKSIDFVPGQSPDGFGTILPSKVSAVWPGPHALTTRVKRCGQGHMGFQWCGLGHTKQGRLSSGVARATRMETFNQKVMEHERTQCGNFVKAHVFAVWPGPHALTTRVKRCEPANTGFRRCGPGHTNQGCLSSRVACVEVLFAQTASGRFYPPKNLKCVAWATRIDNEG